jgi:hypothetical protein
MFEKCYSTKSQLYFTMTYFVTNLFRYVASFVFFNGSMSVKKLVIVKLQYDKHSLQADIKKSRPVFIVNVLDMFYIINLLLTHWG